LDEAGGEEGAASQFLVHLPDLTVQHHTVHVRQVEVENRRVEYFLPDQLDRAGCVGRRIDLVALNSEDIGQEIDDLWLVVDNEDPLRTHRSRSVSNRGSTRWSTADDCPNESRPSLCGDQDAFGGGFWLIGIIVAANRNHVRTVGSNRRRYSLIA
jgi:hypothetical protein